MTRSVKTRCETASTNVAPYLDRTRIYDDVQNKTRQIHKDKRILQDNTISLF